MGRDTNLEDDMIAYLREWLARVAPTIKGECDCAELTFRVHSPQDEDDGTLWLEAQVEEKLTPSELSGRIPGARPR